MLGATLTISIDILRLNDDEKRPGMEIGKIVWRGVDFVGVNGFSFIVVCEVRCWEGVWWTPDTSYHKDSNYWWFETSEERRPGI